jgi:zinc transporter 7
MIQHNFTDGMALGSAFLLHGSVGGWSRTLFLLAHELPQEVIFVIKLNLISVLYSQFVFPDAF